jgi:uncharacterized protein
MALPILPEHQEPRAVPPVDESATRAKLERLRDLLGSMPAAVVGFSGGVDSALLAYLAGQSLGARAQAITADSPSLARSELAYARDFAHRYRLRHSVVPTDELNDRRYLDNAPDRCYFCKSALMAALAAVVGSAGSAQVLLGVNMDDLRDYRPGQQAARERDARFPFVEVGLTKREIRWIANILGLPGWDKPAAACLSSRIAYGVPVTREALLRIETSEEFLKGLGMHGQVRVRDQGNDLARIEVAADAIAGLLTHREHIVTALKEAGFRYVTLDLEGYRQGSHNLALRLPLVAAP